MFFQRSIIEIAADRRGGFETRPLRKSMQAALPIDEHYVSYLHIHCSWCKKLRGKAIDCAWKRQFGPAVVTDTKRNHVGVQAVMFDRIGRQLVDGPCKSKHTRFGNVGANIIT